MGFSSEEAEESKQRELKEGQNNEFDLMGK